MAIATLPRKFVVFDAKLAWVTEDGPRHQWLDNVHVREAIVAVREAHPEWPVHHILEFKHWHVTVDFNAPKHVQNELVAITEAVETECPVGAAFGVSGTGEGVVWVGQWRGKVRMRRVSCGATVTSACGHTGCGM